MAAKPADKSLPPYFADLRANLAINLRAARLAADLTQKELGALSLVARDYVRCIEAQATNVSLKTLCAIAVHVNKHPFELLSPPTPPVQCARG